MLKEKINRFNRRKIISKLFVVSFFLGFILPVGNFLLSIPNSMNNSINEYGLREKNTTKNITIAGEYWTPALYRSVGESPYGLDVGDVDNDGDNDIITADYKDNTTSIIRWDSYNENWKPRLIKEVGDGPMDAKIADLNNDGYNDIITGDYSDNTTSILLWNDTLHDWNSKMTLNVGDNPWRLAIGDVNNDGINDILTSNYHARNISILLWNQTIKSWNKKINKQTGNNPSGIFVGDANNDDYNDIVIVNEGDDNISIYLWNQSIHTWNDQKKFSVGFYPKDIFIGDVNNDKENDIIVSNHGDDTLSLFLWNSTNSCWDYNVKSFSVSKPCYVQWVYIADANNDGLNDIITIDGCGFIAILLWSRIKNDWYDEIVLAKEVGHSGVIFPVVGDVNNDNYNDIVGSCVGDDEIAMYLGKIPKNIEIIITDQIFTKDSFNFTFFIQNSGGSLIVNPLIKAYWDGKEVSSTFKSLGSGFYFISLDPITVAPGEDPILLNMTINADGYEEKYFETELAVDPETIEKGQSQEPEEPEPPEEPDEPGDDDTPPTPPVIAGYNLIILIAVVSLTFISIIIKKKS